MYLTINVIDDNILKLSSYLTIIWGRVHHGIAPNCHSNHPINQYYPTNTTLYLSLKIATPQTRETLKPWELGLPGNRLPRSIHWSPRFPHGGWTHRSQPLRSRGSVACSSARHRRPTASDSHGFDGWRQRSPGKGQKVEDFLAASHKSQNDQWRAFLEYVLLYLFIYLFIYLYTLYIYIIYIMIYLFSMYL